MKGFSAHLVIFAVVAIVGFGLYYFTHDSDSNDVKGISDLSQKSSGVTIYITSKNTSWDLFQYLCKDMEECTKSADSGKRISKTSGDVVDLKNIYISPDANWNNYSYLKLYVRSSYDVISDGFEVVSYGNVPDTDVLELTLGSSKQKAVILPIISILETYYQSASFSN